MEETQQEKKTSGVFYPSDLAKAKNIDLKSVWENEWNLLGVWPSSANLLCVSSFVSSCFFAPLLFVESAVVEEGP